MDAGPTKTPTEGSPSAIPPVTTGDRIVGRPTEISGSPDEAAQLDGPGGDGNGLDMDALTEAMSAVRLYGGERKTGALKVSLRGPCGDMDRISAHADLIGEEVAPGLSHPQEDGGVFAQTSHPSFDLYKRRRFMNKPPGSPHSPDFEDDILLDPESAPKFEGSTPGTLSVDGFGLECWDFEDPEPDEIANEVELPALQARTVLRRLHQLQSNHSKIGTNPESEELNLKEVVGSLGLDSLDEERARDQMYWIVGLYSLLNRSDAFVDFTTTSSVGTHWSSQPGGEFIGMCGFLRQLIIAKELAMRLDVDDGTSWYTGFSESTLASLIVSDRWLKHVEVRLTDPGRGVLASQRAHTAEARAEAEELKCKADRALEQNDYEDAIEGYTEAITIDLGNPIYRCKRAIALIEIEKYDEAAQDANIATQFDPEYSEAWSLLGTAQVRQGLGKRAKESFEKALGIAGKDATDAMKQGLVEAETSINDAIEALESEPDIERRHEMQSALLDQDWEIAGKSVMLHSLVHEQQVEGLLLFAQQMKWPYIEETREFTENVYRSIHSGEVVNIHLHDWLYGLVLPGKWFAFKLMTSLILSTPSIRDEVGVSSYYDGGLLLPTASYWRARTVMASVLGCLPGVTELCGWIGPCPVVEFDEAMGEGSAMHVQIDSPRIPPDYVDQGSNNSSPGNSISIGDLLQIQPMEGPEEYLKDMKDPSKWTIPEAPTLDSTSSELKKIQLSKLSEYSATKAMIALGLLEEEFGADTEYSATIVFQISGRESPVTYTLRTSPMFVTLPPCEPGPTGAHAVHTRELPLFQKAVLEIDQLEPRPPGPKCDFDEMQIVNATGKGAEVLARAWCAEREMNAVIRRPGGPCYACAVRAAGKQGLNVGALIWVG